MENVDRDPRSGQDGILTGGQGTYIPLRVHGGRHRAPLFFFLITPLEMGKASVTSISGKGYRIYRYQIRYHKGPGMSTYYNSGLGPSKSLEAASWRPSLSVPLGTTVAYVEGNAALSGLEQQQEPRFIRLHLLVYQHRHNQHETLTTTKQPPRVCIPDSWLAESGTSLREKNRGRTRELQTCKRMCL